MELLTNFANRWDQVTHWVYTWGSLGLSDSGLTERQWMDCVRAAYVCLKWKRALKKYGSDMPQRHQINSQHIKMGGQLFSPCADSLRQLRSALPHSRATQDDRWQNGSEEKLLYRRCQCSLFTILPKWIAPFIVSEIPLASLYLAGGLFFCRPEWANKKDRTQAER